MPMKSTPTRTQLQKSGATFLAMFVGVVCSSFPAHAEYKLEVVARTGGKTPAGNTISNLGWGPSINDAGRVAYKVEIVDGREGVYVSGETTARSGFVESFTCRGDTFSSLSQAFHHDDVVQINNEDRISWRVWKEDGLFSFIFRLGASASDLVVVAPSYYDRIDTGWVDFPSPFCSPSIVPAQALKPWITLNNSGKVVFSGLRCPNAVDTVLAALRNPDAYCPNSATNYWFSWPHAND